MHPGGHVRCCQRAVELLGERASNERKVNPTLRAGSCVSFHSATFAVETSNSTAPPHALRAERSPLGAPPRLLANRERGRSSLSRCRRDVRGFDEAAADRSGASVMTIGIVLVACRAHGSTLRRRPRAYQPAIARARSQERQTIQAPRRAALFELEMPSLDIAEVAEPEQKLAAQVGHYRSVGLPASM